MAVALRFQRIGKTKRAFYRMVAIDVRKKRDAKPIEILGHYDPFKQNEKLSVKEDRLEYWISKGAKLSVTLKNLLKSQHILKKTKEAE